MPPWRRSRGGTPCLPLLLARICRPHCRHPDPVLQRSPQLRQGGQPSGIRERWQPRQPCRHTAPVAPACLQPQILGIAPMNTPARRPCDRTLLRVRGLAPPDAAQSHTGTLHLGLNSIPSASGTDPKCGRRGPRVPGPVESTGASQSESLNSLNRSILVRTGRAEVN